MNLEALKEIMVDALGVDDAKISPEAKLDEDLGIDSLDAVELTMAIEDKLGIKIPDSELENLKTVQNILDCVNTYKEA